MSVSVTPQSSNRRYQSALFLARRETSSPRTMPTWANATSLVRRANPERLSVLEPDSPRSSWQVAGPAQESIGQAAKTQEFIQRADQRRAERRACRSFEVGPIGGD